MATEEPEAVSRECIHDKADVGGQSIQARLRLESEEVEKSTLIREWQDTTAEQPSVGSGSIIYRLFDSCISLLRSIVKCSKGKDGSHGDYIQLQESLVALILWSEDHCLSTGNLDTQLNDSDGLREIICSLLLSLADLLVNGLLQHIVTSPAERHATLFKYNMLSLMHDVRKEIGIVETPVNYTHDNVSNMAATLATLADCLIALNLEQSAKDDYNQHSGHYTVIEDRQPYLYHVELIKSKFPMASPSLLERLGKCNWERYLRLQECRETIKDKEHFQSEEMESKSRFYDSALGTSMPAQSELGGSVSTYAETVVSSRAASSHQKLPKLPSEGRKGKRFTCQVCNRFVAIRYSRDWKRHVFQDLLAYTCIYEGCLGLSLWEDRHAMTNHLTVEHGLGPEWKSHPCPLCRHHTGEGKESISLHVSRHMEEIALNALPSGYESDSESEADSSATNSSHSVPRQEDGCSLPESRHTAPDGLPGPNPRHNDSPVPSLGPQDSTRTHRARRSTIDQSKRSASSIIRSNTTKNPLEFIHFRPSGEPGELLIHRAEHPLEGKKSRGRKTPLTPTQKKDAVLMRRVKACETCRQRKEKCDPNVPCKACIEHFRSDLAAAPTKGFPWASPDPDEDKRDGFNSEEGRNRHSSEAEDTEKVVEESSGKMIPPATIPITRAANIFSPHRVNQHTSSSGALQATPTMPGGEQMPPNLTHEQMMRLHQLRRNQLVQQQEQHITPPSYNAQLAQQMLQQTSQSTYPSPSQQSPSNHQAMIGANGDTGRTNVANMTPEQQQQYNRHRSQLIVKRIASHFSGNIPLQLQQMIRGGQIMQAWQMVVQHQQAQNQANQHKQQSGQNAMGMGGGMGQMSMGGGDSGVPVGINGIASMGGGSMTMQQTQQAAVAQQGGADADRGQPQSQQAYMSRLMRQQQTLAQPQSNNSNDNNVFADHFPPLPGFDFGNSTHLSPGTQPDLTLFSPKTTSNSNYMHIDEGFGDDFLPSGDFTLLDSIGNASASNGEGSSKWFQSLSNFGGQFDDVVPQPDVLDDMEGYDFGQ